jgi:hydrogenase maturation protease
MDDRFGDVNRETGAEDHAPGPIGGPDSSHIRVIGIGNEWRGDDAVGLLAARRLHRMIGGRAEVIEAGGEGMELLELMKGARVALLVDAVRGGQAPGTIHRLDVSSGPIAPALFLRSTHAIGVAEAVELARTLGVLPPKVIVYGIEAVDMEVGQPLSPPVEQALDEVVQLVARETEEPACTNFTS